MLISTRAAGEFGGRQMIYAEQEITGEKRARLNFQRSILNFQVLKRRRRVNGDGYRYSNICKNEKLTMYLNWDTLRQKEADPMPKSDMIRARVEPRLKSDVEGVFKQLGLSTSQAIGLFYSQVKMHRGLPFQVRIPNKTTRMVFEQTDKGKGIKNFKNKKELFEDLGLR